MLTGRAGHVCIRELRTQLCPALRPRRGETQRDWVYVGAGWTADHCRQGLYGPSRMNCCGFSTARFACWASPQGSTSPWGTKRENTWETRLRFSDAVVCSVCLAWTCPVRLASGWLTRGAVRSCRCSGWSCRGRLEDWTLWENR